MNVVRKTIPIWLSESASLARDPAVGLEAIVDRITVVTNLIDKYCSHLSDSGRQIVKRIASFSATPPNKRSDYDLARSFRSPWNQHSSAEIREKALRESAFLFLQAVSEDNLATHALAKAQVVYKAVW